MPREIQIQGEPDSRFKLFHALTARKIRRILLVSAPYDAWIMEEDGRLSERITHEYRGLNLSQPPQLTQATSAAEALGLLRQTQFDMVITMPRVGDMSLEKLTREIKRRWPDFPVILLSHRLAAGSHFQDGFRPPHVDQHFYWAGDTDILLAIVKSTEDTLNAKSDTQMAGIRVILFIEDSPVHLSSMLPILYRTLVTQTQAVMELGLNEEHRLLAMRSRPKILIAQTFEDALERFREYEPHIMAVITDTRFPRDGRQHDTAGAELLNIIRRDRWDIPTLLTSSESSNQQLACSLQTSFVDKNSTSLLADVKAFFTQHLGFGDFVFRDERGGECFRASNLRDLESGLKTVPLDVFLRHANGNDFSRWLFARGEVDLAAEVRPLRSRDFTSAEMHRQVLMDLISRSRKARQRGVVVDFVPSEFDQDTEFMKIGTGSLGGKARGLAFLWWSLHKRHPDILNSSVIDLRIPQSLVITTDLFDRFMEKNQLKKLPFPTMDDEEIAQRFLEARMPRWVRRRLWAFLKECESPLAVRSSSLLEDAPQGAFAGMYKTYMLPNDHDDLDRRLIHLIRAVKLVYASTFYEAPRAFSQRMGHRTEEEKMAVLIQTLVGRSKGSFFFPAVSGVAESENYYPFGKMKPQDGMACIALGLGKAVTEGEKAHRFCPKYPSLPSQSMSVDDNLAHAQTEFFALIRDGKRRRLGLDEATTLVRRSLVDALEDPAVQALCGSFVPDENRIRDSYLRSGAPLLTFSRVLNYRDIPLPQVLSQLLQLARRGLGCPAELEFALDFAPGEKPALFLLQLRPMSSRSGQNAVDIRDTECQQALCWSRHALGHAPGLAFRDLVFVRPDRFDARESTRIAGEIARINGQLVKQKRPYLLIGPGRWGSRDPWLGIPVSWNHISGVCAMVETPMPHRMVEPSQGSHFFHNIITLGICYMSIDPKHEEKIDWEWIMSQPREDVSPYLSHLRFEQPCLLKVNGRKGLCVVLPPGSDASQNASDLQNPAIGGS